MTLALLLMTAAITFVATNLDDLALLVGWFSDGSYSARHIAAGQFLGIALLTGVSVLLGLIGIIVPTAMLGILGVIPVGIGLAKLVH